MPEVRLNIDKLLQIERQSPGRADQVVAKVAMDTLTDIDLNWSAVQPSAPGDPPAVDIGNLRTSMVVVPGDAPLTHILRIAAGYGVHLEYGTERMAARPFLLPAVERAAERIPADLLIEVVT